MHRIFFLWIFCLTSARGQKEGESCVDEYSNTPGICTVITRCESARNNFHQNRIVPTFCSNNTSGERPVCCRNETSTLNTPTSPTTTVTDDRIGIPYTDAADLNDRRRVSERKCDEYSRSVVQKVGYIPLIPNAKVFTVSEANCEYTGVELIVGGENAKQGEFPHMAAIGWTALKGGYQFNCGGTLISPGFVLTAAHCGRDSTANTTEPVIVRLGDQNIDNNVYDGADPVDVAIRRIHLHPEYNSPKVYNDIALLELVLNVKVGPAIRPACLWTKNDLDGHYKVIATGWGVDNPETEQTAKELQKVTLSVLDVDLCNRTLKTSRTRNWSKGFIDSQMCVGELWGGKDTCQGDSGGPIQVTSKNNSCIFYIVGVTSVGRNCAKVDRPGVYTRISSYIDWIEGIVWPGQ